jgi:hypothetical protein
MPKAGRDAATGFEPVTSTVLHARIHAKRRLAGERSIVTSGSKGCFAADGGSAGVGRNGSESKPKPIEIIMACEAGRISIDEWS